MLCPRRLASLSVCAALPAIVAVCLVMGGAAQAQLAIGPAVVTGPTATPGTTVALPEDRTIIRKLKLAKEQIEAKSYGEAVQLLGKLLETSEDFFVKPEADAKNHVSLRKDVERLIGGLPEEGRKQYELRFGPAAQQALADALAGGSWRALEDVTRRYFHTEAGYQAAWLLADYQLDQGQPLVAAKTFERLRQAPPKFLSALEPALSIKLAACWLLLQREDRAKAVLDQLSKSQPSATLQLGSKEVALFSPGSDPMLRLRQHLPEIIQRAEHASEHLLARGDAARSGQGASHLAQVQFMWAADHYHGDAADPLSGGSPLFGNDHEADVAKAIQSGASLQRQQNLAVLPAGQPIVVGDMVLMRTATHLVALDCRADRQGNRRWHVARDQKMFDLITQATTQPQGTPTPQIMDGRRRVGYPGQNYTYLRDQALQQRAMFDATYGTISSDGERVFCVEEMEPVTQNYLPYMGGLPFPQQGTTSGAHNRLRAYGIVKPEAKLMWELGGKKSPGEASGNDPLAGAFFLGPPLPLSGRLYALTETNKQIALHAIEQRKSSGDGKLRVTAQALWTQALCNVEMGVETDATRRTAGLTPAHSDGILVCPTAAGAIVAVDLSTRSLLWAYTYGRDEYLNGVGGGAFPPGVIMPVPGGGRPQLGQGQGWADTGVIIADGKVLATERGSRWLHCLNLEDGAKVWTVDRQDGLYVGGVHDGCVLVVGTNSVSAYRMSDGGAAWPASQRRDLPGGVKVAGRGFHHSGVYMLPLDNGRLATVEFKTGELKLTDERVLPEGQGSLGNLVCVNGWLISQDLTRVHGFHQLSLDTLTERIKKSPTDVQALTQLGELLRQKGQIDQALVHLRQAAELSKSVVGRRLVARTLVQALQADFAKYRSSAAELDTLTAATEVSDLRAQYLRTYGDGLLAAGEYQSAGDTLLKLAQGDSSGSPLMATGETLALRNDLWVRSRWTKLIESAPPEVRSALEKSVAAQFDEASRDAAPDALRRTLRYFGHHAAAEPGRQRLAEQLLRQADKPRLEIELLLRGLEQSTDRQRSAESIARLAELFRTSGEWPQQSHGFPAARSYFDRLRGELASVAISGGKTGKHLFDEAVAGDKNFADFLQPKPWPTGKIVVKSSIPSDGGPAQQRLPSGWAGQPDLDTTLLADPLASQYRFQLRNGVFIAQNMAGKSLWRAALAPGGSGDPSRATRPTNAFQTVAYGHRLAAFGHLLALVTGYEIIGIDASPGVEDAQRVLWRHSLTKLGESDQGVGFVPSPAIETMPWGQNVIRFNGPQGVLGSLQPVVSASQVSFLRGTEIVTVDPLSGEVLWKRGGIPQGSDLVGDGEHLLAIGPDDAKASVFRALDGSSLGTRPVPTRTQRMAGFGCRALCWLPEGQKVTLKMVDLLTEKTLWNLEFHSSAKAAFAGPDELAVLDAHGAADRGRDPFQLLSTSDGKVRFSSLVSGASAETATSLYLHRTADRYVLAVSNAALAGAARAVGGWRVMPNGNFQGTAQIAGRVYVIDRRNGKLVKDLEAAGLGLPLHQPPDSPVLAFVTTAYGTRPRDGLGRVMTGYQTVVQFLDKRTGRVVYREAFTPQVIGQMGEVAMTAGPGHKVDFQYQNISLQLTFTDDATETKEKELDLSLGLASTGGVPGGVRIGVPIPAVPLPIERAIPLLPMPIPLPAPVPR